MAHKNKDKNKKGRPNMPGLPKFRDLTAERHLASQKTRVEKLFEEENFEEALELLEPLAEKYPDKVEVFDMLGAAYVALNYLDEGRDAFERAVELTPKGQSPDALARFNLANLYALTGFPLLSYEQTKLINLIELKRALEGSPEVDEFMRLSETVVNEMVAQNKLSRERFLAYAMPLERGQLALQRSETEKARTYFLEASRLNPTSPVPYNSLGVVDMIEGDWDSSIRQFDYVLDKLDKTDLDALTSIPRVQIMKGDRVAAEAALERVRALPKPTQPDDIIKLALTYGIFDDDQAVYDLVQPLLIAPELPEELEGELLEDAVILGAVAATHLGHREAALNYFGLIKNSTENLLLERTGMALANGEEGPRPAGRFFYIDPVALHPGAVAYFAAMLSIEADERDSKEQAEILLQPFMEEENGPILEVLTYQVWTSEDPEIIVGLLSQAITIELPGMLEVVRRLAFNRACTESQRLIIASSLVIAGALDRDEPVTLWLKNKQYTGPLADLARRFQELEGLK